MDFIKQHGRLDLTQPGIRPIELFGFTISRSQADPRLTSSSISFRPPSQDCPGTLTCYIPKSAESIRVMSVLHDRLNQGLGSAGGLSTISVYTAKLDRNGVPAATADYTMFGSVFVSGITGTFFVRNTEEDWSKNWNGIKLSFNYRRLEIDKDR